MNEFDLIERFFNRGPARQAELGIGDDGALLGASRQGRALVCDTMVEGRHFLPDVDPSSLGHKALAVNLSDLAAMGAQPEAFLLALTLPQADADWVEAFARGMFALADRFNCELIGGDTTRGPLSITITATGHVETAVALRRGAAEPGDDLWVSGALGAAAMGVEVQGGRLVAPDAAVAEQINKALNWPEPRVALGKALRHFARAAIDISDGLVGDLGHIASRSRVGIELRADLVPQAACLAGLAPELALALALNGGDDYELAFTAAPENRPAIEQIGLELGLALTRCGQINSGEGISVVEARGRPVPMARGSHDHFQA